MIDTNGLMRIPSVTGVQCLMLLNQLAHTSDEKDQGREEFMQSEPFTFKHKIDRQSRERPYKLMDVDQLLQSTLVEQMKVLGLLWDPLDPAFMYEEIAGASLTDMKLKQRFVIQMMRRYGHS